MLAARGRVMLAAAASATRSCSAAASASFLAATSGLAARSRLVHSLPALTMLSEEEVAIQDMARRFARQQVAPLVNQMDRNGKLDAGLLTQCFEYGLMGVEVPEEYDGVGMSFFQSCLIIEELAKVDPAISVIVDIQNTLINTAILKYGTPEQHKRFLPALATSTLASFALSEASSGSDAFSLKARAAEQEDGSYVLNGQKLWISNAGEAGLFLVFANANPDKGHKGITAFLVEKDTPGLSLGSKEDKLGIRASSTYEVVLEDVRVSASNVLGPVGQGYKIAIGALNEGRIGIAAQMVGLADGCLSATIPYLLERKQFGQPIASFQAMQTEYAQAAVDVESARLLTYNAARLKMNGKSFVKEAAMAKLSASRAAESVASSCIKMCGGVGYTKEFPQEKFYRDAIVGQIYEGTNVMQLMTIARAIQAQFQG